MALPRFEPIPGADQTTIVIAGAGLAGSLLALFLADQGFRVRVVERRPDPRERGFIGGRSINLALSARGIDALQRTGLADRVLSDAIPMRGRMMHGLDASLTFQPYSSDPTEAINSVSRSGLNITLLTEAGERERVELVFGQRVTGVDLDAPALHVEDSRGADRTLEADLIIGADGAYSAVRMAMQTAPGRFNYSQEYLDHGYKELRIPPASECGVDPALHDGFAMDPNALHIWPRGGSMMIALPNPDRSFTCTLFWPYTGEHSFEEVASHPSPRAFFAKHYPDAPALMPTLDEDFAENPTSSLLTVRCRPWDHGGKVALLGDAAHAIVPFYGQGMNAAFEDCVELARQLAAHKGDCARAIERYARNREPNANAIADMALENFVEMRDKVGDPEFLHRKRIEQTLHKLDPVKVRPTYNLVSFSTEPYVEALASGQRLKDLIERIATSLPRAEAGGLADDAFASRVAALASQSGIGRS